MPRLLWKFTTPRRLRRNSFIFLLLWTAVAFAHHSGAFSHIHPAHVPRQVVVVGDAVGGN